MLNKEQCAAYINKAIKEILEQGIYVEDYTLSVMTEFMLSVLLNVTLYPTQLYLAKDGNLVLKLGFNKYENLYIYFPKFSQNGIRAEIDYKERTNIYVCEDFSCQQLVELLLSCKENSLLQSDLVRENFVLDILSFAL
jgi:hypothetical protein